MFSENLIAWLLIWDLYSAVLTVNKITQIDVIMKVIDGTRWLP